MSTHLRSAADPPLLDPAHLDPDGRRRLAAWLVLQREFGLQPQKVREALDRLRDPAAVLAWLDRPSRPATRQLEGSIDALKRHGVRCVPYLCNDYPDTLRSLSDPPLLLCVAGDAGLLGSPAVAIVGARAATVQGREMAREVALALAGAGIVVVSGLARGIDSAAHEGALAAGGRTLAVQACGPDRIYPAVHRGLARRIREQGALVTELPLGAPPRRPHFPLRNRIISGLCRLVIVIEARERSGSLITARHALAQGRDVMALPGSVTAPTSWGPNRLIRDGAPPLLEPADALRWLGVEPAPAPMVPAEPIEASGTSPGAREIAAALRDQSLSRDELARRLDREPDQLALDLLNLELSGEVRECRDGRLQWRRVDGSASG